MTEGVGPEVLDAFVLVSVGLEVSVSRPSESSLDPQASRKGTRHSWWHSYLWTGAVRRTSGTRAVQCYAGVEDEFRVLCTPR